MAITDHKQLFVRLLSNLRQGAENTTTIYQMMSQAAEMPEIKEALEARAFVSNKVLSTIDECFKVIGEQPSATSGRLYDVFIEDFRKDLSEIESPELRHMFILSKANHLNHLRMGEYILLIESADKMGHYGVGLMLASCLADKIAFTERSRRLIRNIIEGRVEARRAS